MEDEWLSRGNQKEESGTRRPGETYTFSQQSDAWKDLEGGKLGLSSEGVGQLRLLIPK